MQIGKKALAFAGMAIGGALAADWDYRQLGNDWTMAECGTSLKQSPIDIPWGGSGSSDHINSVDIESKNFHLSYSYEGTYRSHEVNKGYTLQWNLDANPGELHFTKDNQLRNFKPLQFHFHAPSEHTFNGAVYDLEMHIVHQDTDNPGLFAAFAFYFDRTAGNQDNQWLSQFLTGLDGNH